MAYIVVSLCFGIKCECIKYVEIVDKITDSVDSLKIGHTDDELFTVYHLVSQQISLAEENLKRF